MPNQKGMEHSSSLPGKGEIFSVQAENGWDEWTGKRKDKGSG